MGYTCDHCRKQRSVVYCQSDAACLCLSCDRHVHSANTIVLRHSRTLICQKCNSHPASIRCVDENMSVCQNCDWICHADLDSASLHRLQPINSYSGCLSDLQLSRIWPFIECSTCERGIDTKSVDAGGNCGDSSIGLQMNDIELQRVDDPINWIVNNEVHNVEQQPLRSISSTTTTMNCYVDIETTDLELHEDGNIVQEFNTEELDLDIENFKQLFGVAHQNQELADNDNCGDSSICLQMNDIELQHVDDPINWILNNELHNAEQQPLRSISSTSSMNCYGDNEPTNPELHEDDNIIQEFNTEEHDLDIENFKQFFEVAHQNQELADNDGICGLFHTNDASDITCQIASITERSSLSLETLPSVLSPLEIVPSNFFDLSSRNNGLGASKDSDGLSMLAVDEPPCDTNFFYSPTNRKKAVQCYKEKKKTRIFEKKVRYATRKARADVQKRV